MQERWLKADVALIKAELGRHAGQSHLPQGGAQLLAADGMAAALTIVQVDADRRSRASIDPEQVVTPGIFVDRVVEVPTPSRKKR